MMWMWSALLFLMSATSALAQGSGGSFPTPGGQYVDGMAVLVPCGTIINGQTAVCPPGQTNGLMVNCVNCSPSAPIGRSSNPVSATIASTGVPQLVIAANAARMACILQNAGTHPMNFSLVASGASPLSAFPGDKFYCTGRSQVTATDSIYVSGTAGDVLNGYWQ